MICSAQAPLKGSELISDDETPTYLRITGSPFCAIVSRGIRRPRKQGNELTGLAGVVGSARTLLRGFHSRCSQKGKAPSKCGVSPQTQLQLPRDVDEDCLN